MTLQWLPISFRLAGLHMDNCLSREKKKILCFLGFYAFSHTNILRRTVKIGWFSSTLFLHQKKSAQQNRNLLW